MKALIPIFVLFIFPISLFSQSYYLRGEVKDEGGNPIQNVVIRSKTTGYQYYSGTAGTFGITTSSKADTLIFQHDGYQQQTLIVKAGTFFTVTLKALPALLTNIRKNKLASITKDLDLHKEKQWYVGNETYASLFENGFIECRKFPSTDIALNIDKASYSNIRRFINLGMVVPPDAVRIEEMLNNFRFQYEEPEPGELFKIRSLITSCLWNPDNQLLFVNIFSKKLDLDSLPPCHLVFLIDISGSMDMPNRLPLLKSAFHSLASNLREKDTVSIVVYGGAVGIMLQPTSGAEQEKIHKAIDELSPGGSTPGESGIRIAYGLAKNHYVKDGNNRIILATDGDFNVGAKTESELDDLITRHRESGIYLTCLGVGMGNYKDSKIQTLARKGNGNFAYLDTYQEAEKILMKEFTQNLYAVADDVSLNISFNSELVSKYRLIGFDNVVGALYDSLAVIEGGEIGSGQSLMVVFEIEPAFFSGANLVSRKFSNCRLYYKLPNTNQQLSYNETIMYNLEEFKRIDPIYRFANAVIMYGALLRSSSYIKNVTWGEVLYQASESANPTDYNQSQFVELVYKSKELYSKLKKNRKKTRY